MPKPSLASEASWIQTWQRRSRLRSSSQVPHRNPRNPRNTAVIALDDEPIAISEPPSPIAISEPPSRIAIDDEPIPIVESLPALVLKDEPVVIAEAPAPPALEDEPILIAEAPASIAETPLPIATAETPPPPPPTDNAGGYSARNGDGDDMDPQWSFFLDHLKLDGESYRLEMPGVSFKYEDVNDVYSSSVTTPPLSDTRKRKMKKSRSDQLVVSDGYDARVNKKRRVSDQLELEEVEVDEDYKIFRKHVRELPNGSMILELGDGLVVRYEEDEEGGEGRELPVCEDMGSVVDDDYMFFVSRARQRENGSMVLELDNGVVVNYEEEEEGDGGLRGVDLSARAVEVHVKTEHLDVDGESGLSSTKTALRPSSGSSNGSNHVVYEDDGCSIEDIGCTTPLLYGERLKAILDKPFDQNEYDKLMDMAERCKPIEGLRETRGISKSYPTDKLGRSYLDHYPKFAEKLKHVDLDERLKLLRGLFYWLENVVHDGAFKPWECESSSYQTLPSNGSISLAIEIPED